MSSKRKAVICLIGAFFWAGVYAVAGDAIKQTKAMPIYTWTFEDRYYFKNEHGACFYHFSDSAISYVPCEFTPLKQK